MTDPGAPSALRASSGFGRLWTASTASAFGSYVTVLAVQVLVVDTLDAGAAEVGLVSAARWLPYLLFGLLVGVLVDRVRRRPVLLASNLVCAAALAVLPVLAATGHLSVGGVMAVMATLGLATLVGDAAYQSFVPRVVPVALLGRAHARLDQADAVAQGSGPALAGGLVSWVGAPLAVLVDAASYLVAAVLLATVPVREERTPRASHPGGWVRGVLVEAREGVRWVYRHPTLRPFAVSTHVWFACSAVVGAVLAPMALRTLHLSPATFGLALAAAGVGALVGASSAVRLGARFGAGRLVLTTRAWTGAAWAMFASAPLLAGGAAPDDPWAGGAAWAMFAVGQLLLGLCMGAENANEMAYRQTATPDRLQGRMNATMRSINRAVIVVAAPLGGLLGDAIGLRTALYVAAGAVVLTSVVMSAGAMRGAHLGDRFTSTVAT